MSKRTEIEFIVPGETVPKGRPRFGRGGKVFTPPKTKAFEQKVALFARSAIKQPWGGAVEVSIDIFGPYDGDLDNAVKSVLDGLNGIAYHDDRQVQTLHARIRPEQEDQHLLINIRQT